MLLSVTSAEYYAFWPAFRPRKPAVIVLVTDLVSVRKSMVMLEDHFQNLLTSVIRLVTGRAFRQSNPGKPE